MYSLVDRVLVNLRPIGMVVVVHRYVSASRTWLILATSSALLIVSGGVGRLYTSVRVGNLSNFTLVSESDVCACPAAIRDNNVVADTLGLTSTGAPIPQSRSRHPASSTIASSSSPGSSGGCRFII